MAVRDFDGSGDLIQCAAGTISSNYNGSSGGTGWTLFLLAKPTTGATLCPMAVGNAGGGTSSSIYLDSSGEVRIGTDTPSFNGLSGLTASSATWQQFAVTQASTGASPKIHRATLGGAWSHVTNTTGAMGNYGAGAAQVVYFGQFRNGGGDFNGRLATAAFFARGVGDAELETFTSTYAIYTASGGAPTCLWDFNQASTGTSVTDLTGNGADQTSLTGTTVVSDDPAGWTFGTAPLTAAPSLHLIRATTRVR